MATSSIKEDLVIEEKKKILEIAEALKQPRNTQIKPAQPQKLPSNASKLWFKR